MQRHGGRHEGFPASRTLRCAVAVGVASAAALGAPPAAGALGAPTAEETVWTGTERPRAVLFLVDGSDAMLGPQAEGRPRWDAVRDALGGTVTALPEAALAGVRVAAPDPVAPAPDCADTRALVPVAPLDRAALGGALASVVPAGPSATAEAIRAAVDDLPANTDATVVLVTARTGGCVPAETCAVARELVERGVGLRVDTVGVTADPATADDLRCVAEVTGGRAWFADTTPDLAAVLTRAALRALSPLAPSPVPAVAAAGPGPVALAPGAHADVLAPGESRRYVVELVEGDELLVAATAAAPPELADRVVLRVTVGADAPPGPGLEAPEQSWAVLLAERRQAVRAATRLVATSDAVAPDAAGAGAAGGSAAGGSAAAATVPVVVTLEQYGGGGLPPAEVPVLLDVDVVDALTLVEEAPLRTVTLPAPPPERVVVREERVPAWMWGLVAALAWAVAALAVVLAGVGVRPPGRHGSRRGTGA